MSAATKSAIVSGFILSAMIVGLWFWWEAGSSDPWPPQGSFHSSAGGLTCPGPTGLIVDTHIDSAPSDDGHHVSLGEALDGVLTRLRERGGAPAVTSYQVDRTVGRASYVISEEGARRAVVHFERWDGVGWVHTGSTACAEWSDRYGF